MSSYTLTYFNIRGAAEVSRLLFAVAEVEYKDVRYTRDEDWPKHKEEMPMKAMPVLEIDGVKFCQSHAIERYLAREFGLYGKTNTDALKIDEIQEAFNELLQSISKVYFAQTAEEKENLLKPLKEETIPKFMEFFQRRLCENDDGKGYMVGSSISLADIFFYNAVFAFSLFLNKDKPDSEKEDFTSKFPQLSAYYKRISAEPKIVAWVAKRPDSEF